MTDCERPLIALELRRIALGAAVVIGMAISAFLLYRLIDIFFMVFVGIVIAAALQPWHVQLCRWGIPKAVAVLQIYYAFLVGLAAIVLLVTPVLVDQVSAFVDDFPNYYSALRANLKGSTAAPLRLLGYQLPPLERLTHTVTNASPDLYHQIIGATTSAAEALMYIVAVLAIAFYWTLEMGRFERLVVSLMPVERRVHALNIWHEIESKLGGFVRGQGLAMLAIGVASGIGYALIGLPNALALGVVAGLLEAVPLLGPVLAAVPAVLVALPIGLNTTLLVVGFAGILQLTENYVLIPRIMDKTVGVSALVNILAVLAFGTLYGFVGIFVAIPMAATIQVVLERLVIEASPVQDNEGNVGAPWASLRGRLGLLRQQVRERLRTRQSRMGIDPSQADHVMDAMDQRIEQTLIRIEESISDVEAASNRIPDEERATLMKRLEAATTEMDQTIVNLMAAFAKNGVDPDAEGSGASVDELNRASEQIGEAIERVEAAIAATAMGRADRREG